MSDPKMVLARLLDVQKLLGAQTEALRQFDARWREVTNDAPVSMAELKQATEMRDHMLDQLSKGQLLRNRLKAELEAVL